MQSRHASRTGGDTTGSFDAKCIEHRDYALEIVFYGRRCS